MKKRLFPLLMAVLLPLTIASCGSKKKKEPVEPTPSGEPTEPSGEPTAPTSEPSSPAASSSEPVDPYLEPGKDFLPEVTTYYNEPSIMIHYQRSDDIYRPWGLWLWSEGLEGNEYKFNYSDDYGIIAYYTLASFNNPKTLGFIVKQLFEYAGEGVWKKDIEGDRFMDIDMLLMDEHNCYNVYLTGGGKNVYTDPERQTVMKAVKYCEFQNSTTIKLETNAKPQDIIIKMNGSAIEVASKKISGNVCTVVLQNKADVSDIYSVEVIFDEQIKCEKSVSIRKLYDKDFDAKYNYDGELGALYTKEQTEFKVWSPVSKNIKLRIYNTGTPTSVDAIKGNDVYEEYEMVKGEKGVFSVTINGDLEGKYYTYFVTNTSVPYGKEIVDPYAKSAGISGLRGMIVDFSKTNPNGWDEVQYLQYDRKELTVYETHIAELTCSDTWGGNPENARKFKGFHESGTTYTKGDVTVTTGFDHIKELGVNAVQIIPFFDQANDETNMSFNWGYNPLNYNVIEGGYSSDPYDGYVRIRELKELIQAYNEAGITIIMDVVYNHVNGLSGSNFDVLMPYYYFRYNSEGQASNGSGCGNETASDKYMFRKFMIDSTKFWTSEYKLGGYRFDLMGIHDIETMNQLVEENQKINPYIVIYGEPWAGGTTALPSGFTAAVQANAHLFEGYGQFNDKLRDAMIKSGMNANYDRGYVTQTKWVVGVNDIIQGIKGITTGGTTKFVGPDKTISYATCHDNYTLHDRVVTADLANSDIDPENYMTEETIEKMNALANSIVFTSQGTTFMLAGEEMLRTKIVYDEEGNPKTAINAKKEEVQGVYEVTGNSYNSSYKTNEINYEWKVNHLQLFDTYRKLIALRQAVEGFKRMESNQVETFSNGSVIKITVPHGDHEVVVYHVCGANQYVAKQGEATKYPAYTVDTTGYEMYLDTLHEEFNDESMTLKPFETLILYK